MLNKSRKYSFQEHLVATVVLLGVLWGNVGSAEELPLDRHGSQTLMEKTSALEAKIERRQTQMIEPAAASIEYHQGFEDGYNKAIVDLLKSKLLNDPSLSPKPKGNGLIAVTAVPKQAQEQIQQQPQQKPQRGLSSVPGAEDTVPAAVAVDAQASVPAVAAGATLNAMPPIPDGAITQAEPPAAKTSIAPPAQNPSAQEWLQKSNSYIAEKNWPQTIHAASQALALDTDSVDAYIVRSWARAESGQTQEALEDIAAAIRLDAENALAFNNRAYIHELLNNNDQARRDYHKACSLGYSAACVTSGKLQQALDRQKQERIRELTELSYRQFQHQDWKAVVKTTTELLAVDPENTVALVNRAGAQTELGLYTKALEDCNAALILDPNMAIAYNNKGYVLELMGEHQKAAMEYETACILGVQQSCADFKRLTQKKLSARQP